MSANGKYEIEHAKQYAKNLLEDVKKVTCNACGNVSENIDKAAHKAHNITKSSISNLKEVKKSITTYTKTSPIKALALALLAGYVTSKFL